MIVLDSLTPLFNEIRNVSPDYARDALAYASLKLREDMQRRARSYGQSKFGTRFESGHRLLSGSKQAGIKNSYFARTSKKDGKELHDMANFLKFQVSDIYFTSKVGYIDFRGYQAQTYKDGKKVKTVSVKGQAGVHEIGGRLEHGGEQKLTKKQKNLFIRSGWGAAAARGYIQRKARPVVNPSFNAMQGRILGIMQEKYGNALVRHTTKMNVNARRVS